MRKKKKSFVRNRLLREKKGLRRTLIESFFYGERIMDFIEWVLDCSKFFLVVDELSGLFWFVLFGGMVKFIFFVLSFGFLRRKLNSWFFSMCGFFSFIFCINWNFCLGDLLIVFFDWLLIVMLGFLNSILLILKDDYFRFFWVFGIICREK